jgi:predicted RNA-binding protein with PUA-like domain
MQAQRHWLMKSEPRVFSIHDLAKAPKQTAFWDGVRNYQARNYLKDQIQVGDGVLFYHSSAEPPGVAGIATVVRAGSPDPTQWNPIDHHYDAGSPKDAPRWYGVHIKLVRIFPRLLPLDELRQVPALKGMELFRRSRLSVQPVTATEFAAIERLGLSS